MSATSKARALRVLIVRLGAMGDILHALPAVTALRAAHPEWVLGWAVEPHWQALLRTETRIHPPPSERGEEMPLVDRIHLVNARRWSRRPLHPETIRDILRVGRELREGRYDLCIDLQGAVRSALIGRWAAAPRMLGEAEPREKAARWLFNERIATSGRHVIEQAVEVLDAAAGEKLPLVRPLLPQDPVARIWCDSLLHRHDNGPFVLISPGAGWGAKRWPAERYGAVARGLSAMGYRVFVNAGPEEVQLAVELVEASGGIAVPVNPTLGELIELTREVSLVIAGDTGPLHLACALGKPVVGIFGPTDPARNGPFGCDFRVLRHPESKRDHTRHSHPEAGLLTILPEAVLEAAEELLPETAQRTEPDRGK